MSRLARFAGVLLLIACSFDTSEPTPPPVPVTTGTVRVNATTVGQDIDVTGFVIRMTGVSTQYRASANGSVEVAGLPLGSYTVTVSDVAPNCTADAATFEVVIAAAGQTVTVDLRVSCRALGSVQVTVITTGSDPDTNGYYAVATGRSTATELTIAGAPVNGTVMISRVPPGPHVISLRGLAGNCGYAAQTGARDVDVPSGATIAVAFDVVCTPPTWLAFAASVTTTNTEIYVVRSNGTSETRLTNHPALDEDPVWSPDGKRIAFTSYREGGAAIYVMSETGSDLTRLTPTASASYRPDWSPDGSRIAFVSERDGNPEVYVMNADGTSPTRLTNAFGVDRDPTWAPDGTRLAFSSDRDGDSEIYVMQADGSGVVRVTTNDLWDGQPTWSPQGDRLAFAHSPCPVNQRETCQQSIVVASVTGSTPVEVGFGEDPAWSADGSRIAATVFVCHYDFYYSLPCTIAGIGLLTPVARTTIGYVELWDPVLTKGDDANPAWRP